MFLHVGESQVVALDDIVGIFNLDFKNNQTNKQFLESSSLNPLTKKIEEKYSTIILTTNGIYFSSISPYTLQKRIEKKLFK